MTDQSRTYRTPSAIGAGFKPGFYPDSLWEDENFDVLAITIPGNNNAPSAYVIPTTGLVLANFPDGANVTEVPGSKEINHSWELGTTIKPHVHLRKLDAGSGSVFLGFEYQVLRGTTKISGELTATVPVTDVTVLDEILFYNLGDIVMTSFTEVGAQITFRFYRDPTNGADDFAGDIAITTLGWHYQLNSAGSRQAGAK